MPDEDPAEFEVLRAALIEEHQPTTETETLLLIEMAQSWWLMQRAIRLQNDCLIPEGVDEKRLALFLRYRFPRMFNLRMDPYEHAQISGDGYDAWRADNVYLVFEGSRRAAEFLQTFIAYPPSQAPGSFSIEGFVDTVSKRIEQLKAVQNAEGH